MTKSGRKRLLTGSTNAWQSALDRLEGAEPTQAGENPPDLPSEDDDVHDVRRSAVESTDAEGGYAGDAVELGHDFALAEPERPADAAVGDTRTTGDEEYPDDALRTDKHQHALRREDAPADEGEPREEDPGAGGP